MLYLLQNAGRFFYEPDVNNSSYFSRSDALSEDFFNPDSKTKKDNPTERLYNQRTIELGIVIDKYLWQEMQVL